MDEFSSPFFKHSDVGYLPIESPLFRIRPIHESEDTANHYKSPLFRIDTELTIEEANVEAKEYTPLVAPRRRSYSPVQMLESSVADERTRKPSMTRLERLGSCLSWCVLLVPVVLVAFLLYLPSSSQTITTAIDINSHSYSTTINQGLGFIDVRLKSLSVSFVNITVTTDISSQSSSYQSITTSQRFRHTLALSPLLHVETGTPSPSLQLSVTVLADDQPMPLLSVLLSTRKPAAAAAHAIACIVLAAVAMLVLAYSVKCLLALSRQLRSETGRPLLENLIPEQMHCLALLSGLILRTGVPTQLHTLISPSNFSLPDSVLLADSFIQTSALPLVLCCILMLLEGLGLAADDETRPRSLPRSRSRAEELVASLGHSNGSFLRKSHLAPHHPNASFAIDFYLPKALLLILSIGMRIALLLERGILHLSSMNRYLFISWSHRLTSLPWTILIIRSIFSTGESLKRSRHLQSRVRQLAFQLMCNLMFLGSLLWAALEWSHWLDLIRLVSPLNLTSMLFLLSKGYSPLSNDDIDLKVGIFASFSLLLLSYLLSAPSIKASDGVELDGTSHVFIALQRHATALSTRAKGLLGKQPREVFCLELSCELLECSWQTYFLHECEDKPHTQIDLTRLGLTLDKKFSSAEECTSGFIASSRNRIVLSFRGSIGSTNILKSLDAALQPLPNLKVSDEMIASALREVYPINNSYSSFASNAERSPGDIEGFLLPSTTNSVKDWGSTLSRWAICSQTLPCVHRGFWTAYASLRDEVFTAIVRSIYRHISDCVINGSSVSPATVYFCGHSLGGAMAVLAAYELVCNIDNIIECISIKLGVKLNHFRPSLVVYTYGTPRVGNTIFASQLSSELRNYYRVEVDGDLVPMLPRFFGFYRHGGVQVLLDAESAGSVLVKPTIVESMLLRSSTGNISNHTLTRYRDSLEACFEQSELLEYLRKETSTIDAAETKSLIQRYETPLRNSQREGSRK